MDFKVEQVSKEIEESVLVRCHDPKAEWVNKVHEAAEGQVAICGSLEGKLYQIKLIMCSHRFQEDSRLYYQTVKL